MPLHDWTRVPAGLYHDFHQSWSVRIKDALNAGRLPKGTSALVEQWAGPREGDVLAIESHSRREPLTGANGGVATMSPPVTRIVRRSTKELYTGRANRIVVKHHLGRVIAVIEIVSPGNKHSRADFRSFLDKTIGFLRSGVHVLIVDPFPPTPRDPLGIHKAIWDEIEEDEEFMFPPGKDRLLVSYEAGIAGAAYIEPIGVGDALPDMPLCLATEFHIPVPLESTYQATWDAAPAELRQAVETGTLSESEDE
jgi:hypothetical protein